MARRLSLVRRRAIAVTAGYSFAGWANTGREPCLCNANPFGKMTWLGHGGAIWPARGFVRQRVLSVQEQRNGRAPAGPSPRADEPSHLLAPELALIYETAPVGLAFLSPDCRYLQINQHLTEICGIPVAGHIGRTVRETVPAVADQVEEIVARVVRTETPVMGIPVTSQRPDGREADRVWITNWYPLKGRDGTIAGVNVVAEEVTDRRRVAAILEQSAKALEDSEARFAQTREHMHWWNVSQDLLVVASPSGECLSVNPAWTGALGWSESELVGSSLDSLLHPDDRDKTLAELSRRALGRRTQRFQNRLRDRTGTYHCLSWRAVADAGRIYAMGRDITELKQAEDELREMRDELARVTRQTTLAVMTASIAHEINQPLSAIVMNAGVGLRHLAQDPPRIGEASTALKRIEEAGDRAGSVIGSIRGMLRNDKRGTTAVDLNDLVREILALVRGEIDVNGVLVEQHLAEPLPQIVGERTQLQQVVLNLVMNAVEAMRDIPDRRRALDVSTRVIDGRDVLLTVADTGPGIKPEDMSRIFEAFFTTKPQGMGMGLAISRSIVEAHRGRLWACAGAPHGTVFHMQLPRDGDVGT